MPLAPTAGASFVHANTHTRRHVAAALTRARPSLACLPLHRFEFGIDVFQEKSGSDEGFCLEIASYAYTKYEEHRDQPPFVMDCKDMGDGHFVKDVHTIEPKDIPSPPCGGPDHCDLNYYYCPRECVPDPVLLSLMGCPL